jgi:zinc D-Ala-D-Ala carboxypeptidase
MAKLTDHFSLEEMIFSETAARHGINNKPSTQIIQNLSELCQFLLEPIRTVAGGPINVTFRLPLSGHKFGGGRFSQLPAYDR